MADQPIQSLSRARETKINELSTFFANDDLSLEDLERRIERVYKAENIAELEAITADLKGAVAGSSAVVAPAGSRRSSSKSLATSPTELASGRVLSLMSSTRRVGRWVVPRSLDVVAIMSDTRIDITHAILPAGIVDLDIRVVMAAFKLIVPPNVRVINQVHSVMADVRSRADELGLDDVAATASAPVIRLSGVAFMGEVKVIVRRREEPVYDEDDDDDD